MAELNLHGLTDLPPRKIAAVVTYLEMHTPPPAAPDPVLETPLSLQPLGAEDIERYLSIYRMLGERWLWFSRLVMPRAALEETLADSSVLPFAVVAGGRDVGLLELDQREEDATELAFLGVEEALVGSGAGRWLMNRALRMAWARPISRFWVHTCTFDHAGAVAFYRRSGFEVEKIALEIVDDPRLTGHLPRETAPHIPMVEG